jgi:hypothetical protein
MRYFQYVELFAVKDLNPETAALCLLQLCGRYLFVTVIMCGLLEFTIVMVASRFREVFAKLVNLKESTTT